MTLNILLEDHDTCTTLGNESILIINIALTLYIPLRLERTFHYRCHLSFVVGD